MQMQMQKKQREQRGFTLVEMMVVVAIAGIVAGLALPRISDVVRRERARSEVQKVLGALDAARERSRIQVCNTILTVDAVAGTVTTTADPADPTTQCRSLAGATVSVNTGLLTLANFTVGGVSTNPLRYNSQGGISGTTRARMTVTLVGSSTRVIEVWPATGSVRLN